MFLWRCTKRDVGGFLNKYHYIGAQCADPTYTFCWRDAGGLIGNCGQIRAVALFAPPASFAWGAGTLELTRLARDETLTIPLSKFISECVAYIKRDRRFSLLVSYADPEAGHSGGIYRACNWVFCGTSSPKVVWIHKESGRRSSQRSFDQSNYNPSEWTKTKTGGKLLFAFPLTTKAKRDLAQRQNANVVG